MRAMEAAKSSKTQAHELIDRLRDNASWKDVVYRLELRLSIERELADSDAGRVTLKEDVPDSLEFLENRGNPD